MSASLRRVAWLLLALVASAGAAQSDRGALALSEGNNFRTIAQQPLPDAARIEVIDFFFYGCPFCNDTRPMLEGWRKQLPLDVVFRRVPTVRRDSWAPLARTY